MTPLVLSLFPGIGLGGSGKVKAIGAAKHNQRPLPEIVRLQGLPNGFLDDSPFTASGKRLMIGNGVPLAMGRAVARAVKLAMGYQLEVAS